ncbi:MAG TPA: 4-hydroxybenzoate 3-monooxygenase [Steroidobacteraceae bacterium]|nr:4-hydroxybenzoate 3-monooxygenase [Steroidobacteraceae bacterium]
MRTQVAIIGAGPAGLLLSQLLHQAGLDCVVLERQQRALVEGRIRAGVLEQTTVELIGRAGADGRLQLQGLSHQGFNLSCDGEVFRIDMAGLTGGAKVIVYGQTELTRDLIEVCLRRGTPLLFGVQRAALHEIEGTAPYVTFEQDGAPCRLDCDFIAGCDGSHGVSRSSIPAASRTVFERTHPFGWLGLLADVPPCGPELTYCNHERGFALASMRSPTRSRYDLQCALDESLQAWPDERVWEELALRLGPALAASMTRGPSIEKSIAPLRSLVIEPMHHGRLFLAGDAAHIVPPTGAKGLNLAAADVGFLSEALSDWYRRGSTRALDEYSGRALARVWKAERFSWWLTGLTHRFADMDAFAHRMQLAELQYIRGSRAAQTVLAENYVGLPFT